MIKTTRPPSRIYPELRLWDRVAGVYVLQFDRGFYVGSSKNLRARIRDWYETATAPFKWKCFATDDFRRTEQKVLAQLRRRGVTVLNINNAVRQKMRNPRRRARPKPLKGPHIRHWITIGGIRKPMSVWCRETGISVECALARIKFGWTEERAVTTRKR